MPLRKLLLYSLNNVLNQQLNKNDNFFRAFALVIWMPILLEVTGELFHSSVISAHEFSIQMKPKAVVCLFVKCKVMRNSRGKWDLSSETICMSLCRGGVYWQIGFPLQRSWHLQFTDNTHSEPLTDIQHTLFSEVQSAIAN